MVTRATAIKNYIAAQRQLETLRDELARTLYRPTAIELESFADPIDSLLASIDREARLSHLQRKANLYREIMAALKRLEAGEYGICEECEEMIPPQRLKAVPHARRCVRCQERFEKAAALSFPPMGCLASLLAAIREDQPLRHITVVAVTASAMMDDRAEILADSFDGHVSKPVDQELLKQTMNEVLNGNR